MLRLVPLSALLTLGFATGTALAEVKLPAVLSSHMVLQREKAVPIWGTAAPEEKVTVKFRDQEKTATAAQDGKWSVKLDALKAGGPDKLTISGTNTIVLDDVLVGEVWVGSGQSNIAGAVNGYAKGDPVLAKMQAAAPYAKIRLLKGNGKWTEATSTTVPGFSALLFAFGLRLQEALDVPVGLMVGAVGGTPSGYWLTEDMLKNDEPSQTMIASAAKTYNPEQAKKQYDIALAKWEKDAEVAKKDNKPVPRKPSLPAAPGNSAGKIGNLYDAHILPMVPFGIRGVLWDQGESGTAINGLDQFTLMGGLIKGWRAAWGQDFPFLYVQKISGGGCAFDPKDPVTDQAEKFVQLPAAVPPTADGLYRELHIKIMKHPNTFMAISTDLGPMTHPTNKSGYGTRSARVALGAVYGQKVEYYGPLYKDHKVDGNKVRVTFTHVGKGLTFQQGEKLQGFAVAGDDKVFHWAEATIDGDAVIASSEKVANPVAVRYAFASKHPWANLFNKDGLPAQAFRSDSWTVEKGK